MCSRLCHDLVGSTSAINAGLEMIREDPDDPMGPLDLMNSSASQMTRRLAFFRVAFGLAEGAKGPASVGEIRDLSAGLLQGGKATLNWPDTGSHSNVAILPSEIAKVCLNLILAASECLPRGGTIGVHLAEIAGGTGLAIEARGQSARISEDMTAALTPDASLEQLNAHNVHVFFAQSLARAASGVIEFQADQDGGGVQIAVLFPNR